MAHIPMTFPKRGPSSREPQNPGAGAQESNPFSFDWYLRTNLVHVYICIYNVDIMCLLDLSYNIFRT